ncbi:AT-rich interactive domain-containing protein 3A-like isoform X2 [Periophthalmus magnuspinnatus]|uniref:AT-rich interactive domain-containing protein 3A-like isoform X2 n=1 Tax=Periophthalmus magnuspinnatus TaxID=409849 RepID=UPI00145BB619|nr:AT-rich interactive domain-containing protein 3A-like isoform X2 [Periophthalmus magnuspinnatus]
MMDFSKAQMSSLSEQGSPAGLKLEAVMEHLQRQQGAKLEGSLQEKQLQFLFAQHAAAAAAARANAARIDPALFGKGTQMFHTQHMSSMSAPEMERDEDEEDEDSEEEEPGLPGQGLQGQSMMGHGLQGPGDHDDGEDDGDEDEDEEVNPDLKKPRLQPLPGYNYPPFPTSQASTGGQMSGSPPSAIKEEDKEALSPAGQSFTSPNGLSEWGYDESFKQRGGAIWAEESDGGKARGEPSRDFAKLYELDNDPQRKEFLDELFVFMQKRGTPVNRIPIMAKQVLDLYKLYKLVTEKGGLVEVINKKIWREITKGLNLPTSITSAAFTLRTQYMKYLYPFECEKKGLSSPVELQAAIDSNRREGRRPSYTNSLYSYSPSPGSASHALLGSPTLQATPTGHNGVSASASPNLKRSAEEATSLLPSRLPMALALGQQQQQLAQAATLEHLREKLERGTGGAQDGPEKKMMRLAEEQQRLMQQALQQNLLAMASHFKPMNLKLNNGQDNKQDMSFSISTNGSASISVSVEVNGTVYSGTLFAQKASAPPVASQTVTAAGTSGFSALSSNLSPSSSSSPSSSKGPN